MSQDIVSDGLNQVMNARRVEKTELKINRISKVLINIFEMMKENGHIDYEVSDTGKSVVVKILKLNKCKSVKPRYYASALDVDKYARRFLPSRNFGSLIISTNKGLKTHTECIKENVGGSVVAYFY